MSRSKKYVINLALMFFSIAIVVICLETLLRFTPYEFFIINSKIRSKYPKYYLKSDPLTGCDIQENFPKDYFYIPKEKIKHELWSNELSCFDLPYQGKKDYALLVGDSFTFGYCPFEDKWGTLIEKSLNYRVLKCGVPSYGTRQELTKAKRIISKVNILPKLIIVGYFMDDMEDDYIFPKRTVVEGYLIRLKDIVNSETGEISDLNNAERFKRIKKEIEIWERLGVCHEHPYPLMQRIKRWFDTHSIFYNMAKKPLKKFLLAIPGIKNSVLKSGIIVTPPIQQKEEKQKILHENYSFYPVEEYPWIKEAWQIHLKNLEAFKKLSYENGVPLLIVIIPRSWQVYPFLARGKNIDTEYPNRILHNFFKEEEIDYLDLLPLLRKYANQSPRKWLNPKEDLYWRIDGHWSIKGNHLAGLLVSRYILENNLIDIPDKDRKLELIKEKLKTFY